MAKRKIYFVDTESVSNWVDSLESSYEYNEVYLFYTQHSKLLKYDEIMKLVDEFRIFKILKCEAGKNALDLQLSSYLGLVINHHINTTDDVEFVILSNDKDYDYVCNFWKNLYVNVIRQEVFNNNINKKEKKDKNK